MQTFPKSHSVEYLHHLRGIKILKFGQRHGAVLLWSRWNTPSSFLGQEQVDILLLVKLLLYTYY